MRSLFLKIFFSFWLTVVLMGVPFYFVGMKNRPEHPYPGLHDFSMQAMARYGEDALAAWHKGGRDGLRAYANNIEQQSGIGIYLFAGGETPLTGLQAPAEAREIAARIMAGKAENPPPPPGQGARWIGRRLDQNLDQDGQPPVIVLKIPEPPRPPFPHMHGPWDNILFYSVVGGLVCYFLARSLTAPIRKLREATNRIAGGDFSVRVGGELGRQGSEVADLGRDFDAMAERIEALLLAQQRLLRDISHELRSPLARLNVALELARQRAGAEAGQPLARIERESERLNELIGELMTLTRLESGAGGELHQEDFELNGLIGMVAEDARYEARSRGRGVAFAVGEKAFVHGSRELMRRALENVVRNAVRYSAENTEVEIRLTCENNREGRKTVITIRDHGPGVPEETLSHLFKPFYRVAEARDRQSGGTGIGLAIAERAVRLHGGSMTAANAADGGLIVTIALPLTGS